MERQINLRLMESDAKLLMQMCNMLTDETIREIYTKVMKSYDKYEKPEYFKKYYGDFVCTNMGTLAGDIAERLERIFWSEEDIMIDLTTEGQ